jgi:hypothetical protein
MGEGDGGDFGGDTVLTGTEKPTTGIGNFFLNSTFSTTSGLIKIDIGTK